jgi:hypothetical protein
MARMAEPWGRRGALWPLVRARDIWVSAVADEAAVRFNLRLLAGNHGNRRAALRQEGLGLEHIRRLAHGTEGNTVDALGDAEGQVGLIFWRQGRRAEADPRQVDASVLVQEAPVHNAAQDVGGRRAQHSQFQQAIGEQDRVAHRDIMRQRHIGRGDGVGVTGHGPRGEGEGRTLDEGHGTATGERAGANLRALQVKQDGHGPVHLPRQPTHVGHHGGVLVMRPVRHVEADSVQPRAQ